MQATGALGSGSNVMRDSEEMSRDWCMVNGRLHEGIGIPAKTHEVHTLLVNITYVSVPRNSLTRL